jgi:hypothetical protein
MRLFFLKNYRKLDQEFNKKNHSLVLACFTGVMGWRDMANKLKIFVNQANIIFSTKP